MSKTKTIWKSSVTGQIVSEEFAKDNPRVTYEHTIIKEGYTRDELVKAQIKYVDNYLENPQDFDEKYVAGKKSAELTIDYLLSLVEIKKD